MRELVAPAEAIFLDAKLESELVEIDDEDEARELLAEMGVDEPGLDVLARVGFDTLGLQTYLTAGPKEARAWTIRKGAKAPEAAGVIHTDFEKGFIKAEVVSYDDLVAAGSMLKAKEAGKVRMEGKDYVMQDGDVVEFRFQTSGTGGKKSSERCSGMGQPRAPPCAACAGRHATNTQPSLQRPGSGSPRQVREGTRFPTGYAPASGGPSRWRFRLAQIRSSWRFPIRVTSGPRSLSAPFGSTRPVHRMRVPPATGSNRSEYSMSSCFIVVEEPRSLGRSYSVTSMSISAVRPPDLTADLNRVPLPIGPGVSLTARTMSGLYCGSFV